MQMAERLLQFPKMPDGQPLVPAPLAAPAAPAACGTRPTPTAVALGTLAVAATMHLLESPVDQLSNLGHPGLSEQLGRMAGHLGPLIVVRTLPFPLPVPVPVSLGTPLATTLTTLTTLITLISLAFCLALAEATNQARDPFLGVADRPVNLLLGVFLVGLGQFPGLVLKLLQVRSQLGHGVFDLLAVADPFPATAFPLLGLGPLATFRFRPFPPFPLDRLTVLARLPLTNLDVTLTLTFLRRQRPSNRHQHRHCT